MNKDDFKESSEPTQPKSSTGRDLQFEADADSWFEKASKFAPFLQWYDATSGDREEYFNCLQRAVALSPSHSKSLYALGFYYDFFAISDTESVSWYRKAAEQGHLDAMFRLGRAYIYAKGVPIDSSQAVRWLWSAADNGHEEAKEFLGCAYFDGRGTTGDFAQAAEWFRKAVEQDGPLAAYNLGLAYECGTSVPQDRRQAEVCYRIALDGDCSIYSNDLENRLIVAMERLHDRFVYFAYGSNMFTRRLRGRTPSARVIGAGHIYNCRLTFDKVSRSNSGKATIQISEDFQETVCGVLFSIHRDEESKLDKAEDYPNSYEKQEVKVNHGKGIIDAMTYISTKRDSKFLPHHWYKRYVVEGAVEHELPEDYVEHLRRFASIPDPDTERSKREEAILDAT